MVRLGNSLTIFVDVHLSVVYATEIAPVAYTINLFYGKNSKQNLRVPSRSRILTVFTKVNEIFYWEVKKVFSSSNFVQMSLNLTSDVHFQEVVIKKEEQQTFSVDIEVNIDCMQTLFHREA